MNCFIKNIHLQKSMTGIVYIKYPYFLLWISKSCSGFTIRQGVLLIFDCMLASHEETIFLKWGQYYDWPLFANCHKWPIVAGINCGSGCAPHAAHCQQGTWLEVATRKQPNDGELCLDFLPSWAMVKKVKAAVGGALTFWTPPAALTFWDSLDPCSATRLPA